MDEALVAGFDARFGIGQVQLRIRTIVFFRTLWRTAFHLLAVFNFDPLASANASSCSAWF
jgi:hypothetical protein